MIKLGKNEKLDTVLKKEKLTELKDIHIVGEPRLMDSKDLSSVFALYKRQCGTYQIANKYSQAELQHLLLNDHVTTFVIENKDETEKITDFISYYTQEFSVPKSEDHTYTSLKVSKFSLSHNKLFVNFVLDWKPLLEQHQQA